MEEVVLVKKEHVAPGKLKYKAVPQPQLEKLLKHANNPSEVFKFMDGRILTVHPILGFGFLYKSEEVFLEKVVLG